LLVSRDKPPAYRGTQMAASGSFFIPVSTAIVFGQARDPGNHKRILSCLVPALRRSDVVHSKLSLASSWIKPNSCVIGKLVLRVPNMVLDLTLRIAALGMLAALSLIFRSDVTRAVEIKVAITTKAADGFIRSLQSSPSLEHAGIKVVVQAVATDDAALDAVLKGSADLALFSLDVLSKRKFDDQPKLFSVFTRPFFFDSSDQIFRVEDSALGDAVLADVARAGVLPLAYWNRGLSQIVARQPLQSIESFRGLKVAGYPTDWFDQDTDKLILTSLGAEPIATRNVASEFGNGTVGAAIWKPLDNGMSPQWDLRNFDFTMWAIDFQPIVGVLASSIPYWKSLRETEKEAWKFAANEAATQAVKEIDTREYLNRANKKINFVSANRELVWQFSGFVPDKQQYIDDYKRLNDAWAFISSEAAPPRKKSPIEGAGFSDRRARFQNSFHYRSKPRTGF